MKITRIFLYLSVVLTLAITMNSCANSSSSKASTEEVDQSGPEYTSAYVCPMHCEGSGSEQPGECPVCGMDYVANENNSGGNDHHHDHGDHDGHDH
ncbi:heavy metal-binding domain-containing protein [Portibacter marinus]|uniref:heavy metal-binding domain-containing protein n=1 Tax=Portibacter marinus TaxID=2898660 RepID=UPI001F2F6F87|nr:heavy metal-binding domain-containing protein [Portibacter marinus]